MAVGRYRQRARRRDHIRCWPQRPAERHRRAARWLAGRPVGACHTRRQVMTPADIVERLGQAGGDPEQLLLATVDVALATQEPRLREALEAAALPHWFDDRFRARLRDADVGEAAVLRDRLQALPMVEAFAAREGWNVHQSTRLALRRKIHGDQAERFSELSARAAACWPEDGVIPRVEAIYHRLSSEPEEG